MEYYNLREKIAIGLFITTFCSSFIGLALTIAESGHTEIRPCYDSNHGKIVGSQCEGQVFSVYQKFFLLVTVASFIAGILVILSSWRY